MTVTILNKPRIFNTEIVVSELGAFRVQFAGFENDDLGRLKPFTEVSKVIARDGVSRTEDTANRGDVRVFSRNPLTSAERTSVNQILDDHDDTVDTTRQAAQRAQAADLVALKTAHDSGITNPIVALIAKVVLAEAGVDV